MKTVIRYFAIAAVAMAAASCEENENWRVIPYTPPAQTEMSALYVVGNHQGWNIEAEVIGKIYSAENDGIYSGYVYLNGDFKCTTEQNWDGTNYGFADGKLSIDPEAGNITADEGYYFLTVNTNDMTYTAELRNWGLIGDATPGGWDTDTPLTYDATDLKLKADVELGDGTIKIRANSEWTYNLGGTPEALVPDGDNINVKAGTYQVVVDLSTPEYKMELISK